MSSDTRSEIGGVPVAELARQFGTPTFVYDAAMILRRLADLAAFDVVRYAQKACSNLAILDLAPPPRGAGRRGQRRRDPPRLGRRLRRRRRPAADRLHGRHLRRRGPRPVRRAEHPRQLRLARHDRPARPPAPRAGQITLRINPGFGHGHSRKTNTGGEQSKHGIWHEQIAECLERAGPLRPDRHAACTCTSARAPTWSTFRRFAAAMEQAAASVGPAIDSISAGGGLPTPYRPGDRYVDLAAYFALWDAARKRLDDRFGHAVRLEIEPGRYLVAESGYLVAEIRAVKRQGDNMFYLLDAGFNNLARPILYGAYHPMSIVPADGRATRPRAGRDRRRAAVRVGRHLHPGGGRLRRRPPAARGPVGDLLVIECAGAYGFVMGSNYNSRPLAAEVLIDDGQPHLIRRRQTFEEMVGPERMLDW